MKLYYSPGACSLSPHIVAREAGLAIDIEKVDLAAKKTEKGADFKQVNPKGQVPTLQLDNGAILTEGPVVVQYLADQKPQSGLLPAAGSFDRYRVQEWLNFITSELHKGFSPLFRPTTPEDYKKIARDNITAKFGVVNDALAGKSYLTGDKFSVADAYLYVITRWAERLKFDLAEWPNLKAFAERVAARPKVQEALKAEGLLK